MYKSALKHSTEWLYKEFRKAKKVITLWYYTSVPLENG